jgi:hypothetical protein
MLKIRAEQMGALGYARRELFVERGVAAVREHWPQRYFEMGHQQTEALVNAAIHLADKHGFRTGQQQLRFVNLTVALGIDFPKNREMPWAAEVLNDPHLTPEVKLDRLVEKTGRYLRYDGAV